MLGNIRTTGEIVRIRTGITVGLKASLGQCREVKYFEETGSFGFKAGSGRP